MMTATTKTFNIAGSHSGNVIIEDPDLRARFAKRMGGLGISPNSFGLHMAEAAYSPEGAQWVDELMLYLDGNRKIFDDAVNSIPGAASMNLEATYLAWVDFAGMGMQQSEVNERVFKQARIAANHGPTFGTGVRHSAFQHRNTPQLCRRSRITFKGYVSRSSVIFDQCDRGVKTFGIVQRRALLCR